MGGFMKYQEMQQILLKIQKYQLMDLFADADSLNNWLSHLNQKQIKNFLTIDFDKINVNKKFAKECLIDLKLLDSDYYIQDIDRIKT